MKRTILVGAIAAMVMSMTSVALATDTNQVSYWCEDGVKFEPVTTPFHVPEPDAGTIWSLIVIKAGSGDGQNETWDYPDVGGDYSHSSGHDNSHVILCWETNESTTTTVADTTTTTETSTTVPDTTTTTLGVTTTTEVDPSTTTTVVDTTTSTAPLETTTTTQPPELPLTGISTTQILWVALGLLILGGLAIWRTATD